MLKNDYRRALILLRALEGSWRGHVRLERRTLMGSMQFTVFGPGPEERLLALLIGRRRGRFRAHPLGELTGAGRGQAAMRCEFDPRDMGGMALEEYDLAAVARWNGQTWELIMAGFPNGSREMDWAGARDAVGQLVDGKTKNEKGKEDVKTEEPDGGAAQGEENAVLWPREINTPEEPESAPILQRPAYPEWSNPDGADTPAGQVTEDKAGFHVPDVLPEDEGKAKERSEDSAMDAQVQEDEGMDEPAPDAMDAPAQENDAADGPAPEDDPMDAPATEDAPKETPTPAPDAAFDDMDAPAQEEDPWDEAMDAPAEDYEDGDGEESQSAYDALGVSDGPWPEAVEPLRGLFMARPPEKGPVDGFVFVRSEMPRGSGFGYVLTGLMCRDGRIAEAAYAVPGPRTAEPPAGLEDYAWEDGYWILRREVGP